MSPFSRPFRILLTLGVTIAGPAASARAQAAVAVDAHQHSLSPVTARLSSRTPVPTRNPMRAMDCIGIRRALVLSIACQYGNPNRTAIDNEHEKVKTEVDRN